MSGKLPEPTGQVAVRDDKGRFQPGTRFGGRPKGSRNQLAEDFLGDLHAEWKKRGKRAVTNLPDDKLVDAAIKVLPKEMHLEAGESMVEMVRRAAEILEARRGDK